MSNLRNTTTVEQNPFSSKAAEQSSNPEQRLRQAAHILANGAIRAALKRRSQQADDEQKKLVKETNEQSKAPNPYIPPDGSSGPQGSPLLPPSFNGEIALKPTSR